MAYPKARVGQRNDGEAVPSRPNFPQLEQQVEATYWESLDQMLARMDIISINCPHTPATYHLLSARRLKLLQPKAYIVNTARGEAINPKLLRLDNVVLLPHMGSATIEGRVDMGEKVIINIKTFVDGHKPPDRVIESML